MNVRTLGRALVVVSIVGASVASAEELAQVRLKSRTFTPSASLDALDAAASAGVQSRHFFVQLAPAADRGDLEELGVRVTRYIPDHTWVASFPRSAMSDPTARGHLAWAGEIEISDKMPARLLEGRPGAWAIQPDGRVELRVRLHDDADVDAFLPVLTSLGAEVRSRFPIFQGVTARTAVWTIELIAARDEVMWISEGLPAPQEENDGNRVITGAEIVQGPPYDLDGSGVHVGIWDGGRVDPTHDDFAGRLTVVDTAPVNTHSTHVAGTVGGSGILSQTAGGTPLQWRGMAPDVLLYSWDFDGDVIEEAIAGQATYDIDLNTNSWGYGVSAGNCDIFGDYDFRAAEYDALVRGAAGRPMVVVFSAGNERDDGDCPLPEGAYACINPPKPAKNNIVVGATNSDDDTMTWFSSWGPVDDGRLKPDVCAPGCEHFGEGFVRSTLPTDTYGGPGWCGTSMAAPTCTGNIALLYELYAGLNAGADPDPSLLKALLIATAEDLGNPGPDYSFGHGRIDSQRAALALLEDSPQSVTISNSAVVDIPFQVPVTLRELRVGLVWSDPDAAPLSNPALVNDLDIVLVDPQAVEYRPWVLNPAQPSQVAVRGVDNLNNVEEITVSSPAGGSWIARITGTNVPQGPQLASLVGLDLQRPDDPGSFEVSGFTNVSVSLTWSNAPNLDLTGTLIVRALTENAWPGPQDGTVYFPGMEEPGVTVVYTGNADHSQTPLTDTGLTPFTTYYYTAYSFDDFRNYSPGVTVSVTTDVGVSVEPTGVTPIVYALGAARPNPARTRTSFELSLPAADDVRVRLFDAAGRQVRTLLSGHMDAGVYRVSWDGRDNAGHEVSPGVYFYEVRSASGTLSRRLSWVQ